MNAMLLAIMMDEPAETIGAEKIVNARNEGRGRCAQDKAYDETDSSENKT